jgi:transposase InsO family protein
MEFLQEALTCEKSFKEICQDYGISRKTGYKWVDRYKSGEDLTNLSTRPLKSPNKISPEMENLIKSIREKHPYWGAKKLRKILENQGYTNLPSVTTFSNVIKRNGQITQEESQKHTAYKRFEKEAPNIMWQMDFKGEVKEKERGQYVYPLTIKDDKSRYCIEVKACRNQKFETVKAALIQCFREYGMPKIILLDNGKPWGDSKLDVVTKMDIW